MQHVLHTYALGLGCKFSYLYFSSSGMLIQVVRVPKYGFVLCVLGLVYEGIAARALRNAAYW